MSDRTLDDYLYKYELQTRLLDQSGGHLNNTVYAVLFENALQDFMRAHGLPQGDMDYGWLVRAAQTDFNAVVKGWPNPITIGIGCRKLGGSSVQVEFAVFQDTDDARAIGTQTLVFVNKNTARPDSEGVTSELREAFNKMLAHTKARDGASKL